MANKDPFADFLNTNLNDETSNKSAPISKEKPLDSGLLEFPELDTKQPSFNLFSESDIDTNSIERRKSRAATIKMTKEEYRKRLEELNENSEIKNYVIFFGIPDCGKSYIIASLLHYMNAYLGGNTRINKDVATKDEALLYNQMLEMFANPERNVGRTDVRNFFELNIIFKPSNDLKVPVEMTFIDASGEHLKRLYEGGNDEYAGELPDYLEAILESDVNCKFVFVYDQSKTKHQPPQSEILKAMYDKVLMMQDKYGKTYPKVLLLSKSDKIPEKIKQKYGHSAKEYALAQENDLRTFAQGFFTERNNKNRSIFYSMGSFTKYDDLDKFDADCPHRLFDWIYTSITGFTVTEKKSWWIRFKQWLLGKE